MPDFNRAAKGIKQFENINSAKLTAVANSISPLASSISVLGNMQFNNKGLTNFINSITRLSNSNINGMNINAIGQLGNAIVGLSSTLQGAQNVSTNVIQLTNAVGRLANAGQKQALYQQHYHNCLCHFTICLILWRLRHNYPLEQYR